MACRVAGASIAAGAYTLSEDEAASDPVRANGSEPRRDVSAGGDVGSALRSIYQKTIEEKVPDEFLDLLGKLG